MSPLLFKLNTSVVTAETFSSCLLVCCSFCWLIKSHAPIISRGTRGQSAPNHRPRPRLHRLGLMHQRRHLEETINGTMTLLCTIMEELWSSSHINIHTGQQWLFLELFRGRNSVYETRRDWNTERVSDPSATRSLSLLSPTFPGGCKLQSRTSQKRPRSPSR